MTDEPTFTVLCVDDVADIRLSVSLLLAPEGYRVLEAATGAEALTLVPGADLDDFNNLLTVVTGYSDILLGGRPEDVPHRGPMEEVKRAGERAASLTHQLLAFSRRQILSARVLDLNAVVRGAEAVLRRTLGGVELHTTLAPDLGRIKADAAQIGQVVTTWPSTLWTPCRGAAD